MVRLLLAVFVMLPSFAAAASFRVVSVEGGFLTVDGQSVGSGASLADGAVLHLASGKVVLDFGGEGRLLLTGPADVTVETRGLSILDGGLLSVLNHLVGGFTVRTHTAVAAVRGTEFYIEPRGERDTYLCLCHGEVVVTASDGAGKPIAIKATHHKPFVFSGGRKGLVKKRAKMEHHTDAEIANLLKG